MSDAPTAEIIMPYTDKKLQLFRCFTNALERLNPYPYPLHINNLSGNLVPSWEGENFSAHQVREMWKHFIASPGYIGGKGILNLYIGTPFCSSKCKYCIYFKKAAPSTAELSRYVAALVDSVKYYKSALAGGVFTHVYFGGGTPSLFEARQIADICSAVRENIRVSPDGDRVLEVNPRSVTREKLEAAATFFNSLSIGVQSLDPAVLKHMGRGGQTFEMVRKTVEGGRKAGFKYISLDLLRGLYGDNGRAFLESLKKTLSLSPDLIKGYPVMPSTAYLSEFYGGSLEQFLKNIGVHKQCLKAAGEIARKNGYMMTQSAGPMSSTFLTFHKASCIPIGYSFRSQEVVQSVFGFGHHANSYINGIVDYHSTAGIDGRIQTKPGANIYRGMKISKMNEMRRHVLACFSSFETVYEKDFKEIFHTGLHNVFKREIKALSAMGKLRLFAGGFSLRPTDPRERLACAMFFVDFDCLSGYIKNVISEGKSGDSGRSTHL